MSPKSASSFRSPRVKISSLKEAMHVNTQKYQNIKDSIDKRDFMSRIKIKKKSQFLSPDSSVLSTQIQKIQKSLGYSKTLLRKKLNEKIQAQTQPPSPMSKKHSKTISLAATLNSQTEKFFQQVSMKTITNAPKAVHIPKVKFSWKNIKGIDHTLSNISLSPKSSKIQIRDNNCIDMQE